MIAKLFDTVFGCWHSRYSFPLTVHSRSRSRSRAASVTGTYVVCLDCGKELPYDWDEMKIVTAEEARRNHLSALASKHAA